MSENARILIVDDDLALLEALPQTLHLRLDGIQIDTCDNAAEALERVASVDYDAVVTDIKMPGRDGLEILREIKQLRPKTPTLLITGHGEHDLAVQALRGGAYDFVQKPIDREYFVASLQRAIELRRLERQVEEQRLALERHARVLEHVDNGVLLVDQAGVVRHWNPGAAAITGLAPADVLGRPAAEVLPGWEELEPLIPVGERPGPGGAAARALPLEVDDRELWLSISGVHFGEGVVYAFRDVARERTVDELKDDFVATISHELRTPLAAIYGAAQTLRREDLALDVTTSAKLLGIITAECERLTRIAGDILLANTLDSGRLKLDEHCVELGPLARDVVDQMRACFVERDDIEIDLAAEDGAASVLADENRLRQVLINLIENAIKYSPDGGRVELEIEPLAGSVRIAVRDQGIGIPSGEQQRVFGKFYRVDPQLSRGVGGSGLGLYISRELVRRMHGRISVASREGTGSTFYVDLPLARVAATPKAEQAVLG
jgi:signal transduction histidine kinase